MLLVVAAALYLIAGAWFYFFAFEFFRARNAKYGAPGNPRRKMFEPPQDRALILFFKVLGGFLALGGLLFAAFTLVHRR